jgi:lipopolysaccharide/colanic/teichoic acid biosynthesis glycosyltransferase
MSEIAGILTNSAVLAICCGVAFYYNDPDDLHLRLGVFACLKRLVQSIVLASILLVGLHTIFPDESVAEGSVVAGLVLLLVMLLAPLRSAMFRGAESRGTAERVLIVGASELTLRIINEIDRRPDLGYEIVGIIDDGGDARLARDGRLVGPLGGISRIVNDTKASRVIVALAERRGRLPVAELLDCQRRDVIVEDGVQAYERLSGTVPIQWIAPSQLLFASDFSRSRRYEGVAHACMRAIALIALIATAPLLIVIGAVLKLQSRGPILEAEECAGLLGRPFRLLAFRTTPQTRTAHWLRTLRLHRLPQLINLARGELALIGPRPLSVSSDVSFGSRIPYDMLRHRVRPGLTGWAQVRNGDAHSVDEASNMLRLDLYYIKHRCLSLDLRIVVDTLKMMRTARGVRANAAAQRGLAPGRS